jgi:hypothetical protein
LFLFSHYAQGFLIMRKDCASFAVRVSAFCAKRRRNTTGNLIWDFDWRVADQR